MRLILLFNFGKHFGVQNWLLIALMKMLMQFTLLIIIYVLFVVKYTLGQILLILIALRNYITAIDEFSILLILN